MTAPVGLPDPEVHRALGRIEGKLDGIIQRQDAADARASASDARTASAERRISALETRMNYFLGIAAAIGAVLPLLIKKLFGLGI